MAMSGTFHLNSDYVSGQTVSDSFCFSNFVLSRRTLTILPSSSCLAHKLCIAKGRLKCVPNSSSFVCQASSGGYRRNPDFSRVNKHGFRGRNRQSEERDNFDVENSEMLSSRNGPLLSLSNSPKFQATSSPGPREKEIVELFRKVQAQLRARAAAKKEDKKIEEASKGQGKESETVDSLLKLLRKHSGEQSKKKVSDFSSQGDSSYPIQGHTMDKQDRGKDHNASSFTRPTSSFRRKSPVPRSKSPPTYSSEATFDQSSSYSVTWTQKKGNAESYDEHEDRPEVKDEVEYEHEPEYESESRHVTTRLEPESELQQEPSSFYQEEDDDVLSDDDESLDEDSDEAEEEAVKVENVSTLKLMEEEEDDDVTLDVLSDDDESLDEESDEVEEEAVKEEDLSTLKLMELRGMAKSRGLKGFSKMKKAELVELLSSKSS